MEFTHAVGYRGYCAIKAGTGESNPSLPDKEELIPLLCTGGSISLTQDPIMSSGVWGAGYANIAQVAFAFNYLNLEGSANLELTTKHEIPVSFVNNPDKDGPANANQGVWNQLRAMAFTGRTNGDNAILMYPDGVNGFYNFGWMSSLGFDASEGSAVTSNFNFKGDPGLTSDGSAITCSDDAKNYGNAMDSETGEPSGNGYHTDTGYWTNDHKPTALVGGTLVPYWETYVDCQGEEVDDVISWSCSYNSDLQFLKCCNKKPDNADNFYPIAADYIMCGEMSCDGSIAIFRLREITNKTNPNTVPFAGFSGKGIHSKKKELKFMVGKNYIKVPQALISSASTSMTTGASYISTEYSFTGLGDGVHSVMTMSVETNN